VTISETPPTKPLPAERTQPQRAEPSANRYALSGRERRRRHWWWLIALLIAIVVGLVTFALAENRSDDSPTALSRAAAAPTAVHFNGGA
jgi:hypothetical protein